MIPKLFLFGLNVLKKDSFLQNPINYTDDCSPAQT